MRKVFNKFFLQNLAGEVNTLNT